jgi:CheY-like chemotaxis protein
MDNTRIRSVLDYGDEHALRLALKSASADDEAAHFSCVPNTSKTLRTEIMPISCEELPCSDESTFTTDQQSVSSVTLDAVDWRMEDLGDEFEQPMEAELQRLLALKSYSFLFENDSCSRALDETLCRITNMASAVFDCRIAVISLIDLGRTVVINATDAYPEEAKVMRRTDSLCGYSILDKSGLFVVNDMRLDERFKSHPFVACEDGLTFYAGAALASPEGYNLGALAIADRKPKSDGLSAEQQVVLRDLARLTVDAFVQHKRLLDQKHQLKVASSQIASASHDLTTPLSALHLSLSLLQGDQSFQDSLSPQHREYLNTVASCADAMGDVCESLRLRGNHSVEAMPVPTELNSRLTESEETEDASECDLWGGRQVCDTMEFVDTLRKGLPALPAQGPVAVSVDPSAPARFTARKYELFRLVYGILHQACERTDRGSICLTISMPQPASLTDRLELLFEVSVSRFTDVPVEPQDIREDQAQDGTQASADGSPWFVQWQPHGDAFQKEVDDLDGRYGSSPSAEANRATFWVAVPVLIPPPSSSSVSEKRRLVELEQSTAKLRVSGPSIEPSLQAYSVDAKRSRLASAGIIGEFGAPSAASQSKAKRALVIDDSLVVRKVIATALSRLGFDVQQAVDGMEGLRKLQAMRFDLVLCDFLMPVMDGLDCVREYRDWEQKHRPHYRQYIVGMSAHASSQDIDRCLSLGMDDYRSKPVNLRALECLKQKTQGLTRCQSSDSTVGARCSSPSALSYMNATLHDNTKVCLIASADEDSQQKIRDTASAYGWSCILAKNGADALRLLKRRNWGAAIFDSELVDGPGLLCVSQFREWESKNRIHRQHNVFLLTDLSEAPGKLTFVQVPEGVNGAMHRPPYKEDLEDVFQSFQGRSQTFNATDIVTW